MPSPSGEGGFVKDEDGRGSFCLLYLKCVCRSNGPSGFVILNAVKNPLKPLCQNRLGDFDIFSSGNGHPFVCDADISPNRGITFQGRQERLIYKYLKA